MQAARKYFNNGEKRGKFTIFWGGVMRTSACFRGKLNNTHISQFKKKKDTGQDLLKGKISMEAPCNGLLVVLDTNCSGDSSKIYRNRINNIKTN